MTAFDIHPAAEQEMEAPEVSGIEVRDLDSLYHAQRASPASLFQPHAAGGTGFIHIEQGEGEHRIDGGVYPYQAGNLIFVDEGQRHAFDPSDRPQGKMVTIPSSFFTECAFIIRHSNFVPFRLSLLCAPVLQLTPDQSASCKRLLNQIAAAKNDAGIDAIMVQLLFSALVHKLSNYSSHQRSVANDPCRQRFDEFLVLLEEGYQQGREVKCYANQMALSYKQLNLLCKRCSGRTAKQLIDLRVNLAITRKLREEGGCIQAIADEFGFDDITNFVRYFKRHNQLTPSGYRAAYQGQRHHPDD
ncbi:AraC family transcriptional regulator [Halomonas denitrificans]|nr:AraC family transcriptional regulator [Halomonas denitrificans]